MRIVNNLQMILKVHRKVSDVLYEFRHGTDIFVAGVASEVKQSIPIGDWDSIKAEVLNQTKYDDFGEVVTYDYLITKATGLVPKGTKAEVSQTEHSLETCPFTDYCGNCIKEGDYIVHPNGDIGRVIVWADQTDPSDRWRVVYGDEVSRLSLQVGERGMAVVVDKENLFVVDWFSYAGMEQ
jgi:hypothetical protein